MTGKRRTLLIITAIVVLLAALAWQRFGRRRVPAGQPPLATLNAASLAALKTDFNAAADHTRLVLLLSPT